MISHRRQPSPWPLLVPGVVVALALIPGTWWMLRTPWVGVSQAEAVAEGLRVASVEAGSSAEAAALHPGDVVLSAGDVRADPAARAPGRSFDLAVKNRYHAGDTVTWRLLREGREVRHPAPLRALPGLLVASHLLLYAPFLLVAAVLGWLRRDDARARRLVLTILALVAGNFLRPATEMSLHNPLGLVLQELCALGRFLGPALLVQWAASFPAPTLSRRAERRLVRTAYGVTGALFLVEQWVIVQGLLDARAPFLLYTGILEHGYFTLRFAVFLAAVVTAAVLLVRASRRLSGRDRSQVRWVVWSAAVVAVADVTLVAGSYWFTGGYSDLTLGAVRNGVYLLLGLGLLIAVLRDDLFDIDRVIWLSLLYFLTTGTAVVLFAALEEAFSNVLGQMALGGQGSFVSTVVSGLIAAAAFMPVRKRLDEALRRMGIRDPAREESTGGTAPA